MAAIEKVLRMKDGFSAVLNKYIKGIDNAVAAEEKLSAANDEFNMKGLPKQFTADLDLWESALQEASLRTLETTDSIDTMIAALRGIPAVGEQFATLDYAVDEVTTSLEDMGLVWTEQADALYSSEKALLLTQHRLEDLAHAGYLAAKELTFGQKVERSLQSVKLPKIFDSVTKRVIAMGLSFVSAQKLLRAFINAAGRAPDRITKKFTALKETTGNLFAGTTAAAMSGMTAGVERLNAALQSESGQKFARALEAIGRMIGTMIVPAFDLMARSIEWLGDHAEPVIIALTLATAVLARNALMAAWAHRQQAAAALAANVPLLAMIAVIGIITFALVKMGVTAGDIFGIIGGAAFGLYAFVYNLIADTYNWFAMFAEFLANLFIDPVTAIETLFHDLGTFILGVLGRVAGVIDKLFGSNFSATVADWQAGLDKFVSDNEENKIKIERMENIDYADIVAQGYGKGKEFGDSLSDYALKNAQAQDIKSIAQNTGAIKDTLQEEDLTALVDMAERQFVSQVNLTAQTPVITVNGANTGNTEADRNALADAIARILAEQIAAGPTVPVPAPYRGA